MLLRMGFGFTWNPQVYSGYTGPGSNKASFEREVKGPSGYQDGVKEPQVSAAGRHLGMNKCLNIHINIHIEREVDR